MTRARSNAAAPAKPGTAAAPSRRATAFARWGGSAAMVVGASFALAMAIGCGAAPGRWLGAIAVGLLFAATYRTWREAAVLSAVSGALGSALFVGAFLARNASSFAPDNIQGFMDAYTGHLGAALGSVARGPVQVVVQATLAAALVGLVAGYGIEMSPNRKLARVIAAALVVACACGVMWSGAVSPEMTAKLNSPPAAGTYRHDGFIYWKTYLNLTRGEPYFSALLDGAAGDTAILNGGYIVNGRFTGWALSPASIRLPYSFYLWRYLAPGGGANLLVVALLLCSLVLAASLWALMPRVGPAAALVPLLLAPCLQVNLASGGLFLPDVWAGLFLLLGFFAWIRERYIAAGALMLAAALCRETAIFALLVLLAWAAWRALDRQREWVVRAVALGCMTAAFALAYWLHLRAGAAYVASAQTAAGTVGQMLSTSAARSFSAKFLVPTEYGTFVYTLLYMPGWLPLVLQFPGWFVALRASRDALVPVLAYAAFWIVFTAVFGATSSYWGVLYMPLAITGTAALFAWAGMRGSHAAPAAARA